MALIVYQTILAKGKKFSKTPLFFDAWKVVFSRCYTTPILRNLPEFFVLSRRSMRSINGFGTQRVFRLIIFAFSLILLTSTAHAYTVVLRSGRVVEIPATFTVATTTLTYEVGPGIQVTLQLASINIPATERVNREPPGTFMRHAQQAEAVTPQKLDSKEKRSQVRKISNGDLESFARARRESEIAYERRRQQLGLPSREESQQRAEAEAASIRERFEQSQLEEEASEAYWRGRASALKTELEVNEAQIDSIQRQNTLVSYPNGLDSVAILTGVLPSARFGRSVVSPALRSSLSRSGVFVAPLEPQPNARIRSGAVISRGQVFLNPITIPSLGERGLIAPFVFGPNIAAFGYYPFDSSYERSVLIMKLHELVTERAGLVVRWRALEEEARRAGALPGWLRP
jgi:hypothetical protein